MIYDCCLYNGEKDLFRIRYNELLDLDVIHVVIIGEHTHTGELNNISLSDFSEYNQDRVQAFMAVEMPIDRSAKEVEIYQRNAINAMLGVLHPQPRDQDIIIIADVDEIPSKTAVKSFTPNMMLASLEMKMYGYYLNCSQNVMWDRCRICSYEYLRKRTANEVRDSGYPVTIYDGGWHFSYCGDVETIMHKLRSFSHTEYNTPSFNNKRRIEDKIRKGESLFSEEKWTFVPIDNTFPKYVQQRQFGSLKHLIKQL